MGLPWEKKNNNNNKKRHTTFARKGIGVGPCSPNKNTFARLVQALKNDKSCLVRPEPANGTASSAGHHDNVSSLLKTDPHVAKTVAGFLD